MEQSQDGVPRKHARDRSCGLGAPHAQARHGDSPMKPLAIRIAVSMLATLTSMILNAAPQSPAQMTIWLYNTYPPVAVPGEPREQLAFLVSSGGHTTRPNEEPSHLRVDVSWSGRDGVSRPRSIGDGTSMVVRLHSSTGVVDAP